MNAPMHSGAAMGQLVPQSIQRWSTDGVSLSRRFDRYAEILSEAIDPMRVASRDAGGFHADISAIEMGPITVVHGVGTTHRCVRDDRDIARTREQSFHLIVNTGSPWALTHRGPLSLRAGDAVLLDSRYRHDFRLADFDNVHLKLSDAWLRQWVAAPDILVGRGIPFDSRWGRALTSFATQLTPEFVAATPLPVGVIADGIGALLALTADEIVGSGIDRRRATAMRDRIRECIVQRCTEFAVSADDVATALGISVRTLHRALGACGETFSTTLMNARVALATRMLQSRLHDRVALAEVGRRAGFADASHFARVMRTRTGFTPSQIRRGHEDPNPR